MYDNMKLQTKIMTAESKILRHAREKYKRKARNYKGNYPVWQERMKEADDERSILRVRSRYLGLARAFLKNRHYKSVENKIREGNEVCPDTLLFELNMWGYEPEAVFVERWLEAG